MATASSGETPHDEFDAIVSSLIGDNAALLDAAFSSHTAGTRISKLERLLLIETVTAQLSEALARALAEELAPEIMKALEKYVESARNAPNWNAESTASAEKQKA